MCYTEYAKYRCGHKSMPVIRSCPKTIENPANPVCGIQAELEHLSSTMCSLCERVFHIRWVAIQDWEHRWLHERGACGCDVVFDPEPQNRLVYDGSLDGLTAGEHNVLALQRQAEQGRPGAARIYSQVSAAGRATGLFIGGWPDMPTRHRRAADSVVPNTFETRTTVRAGGPADAARELQQQQLRQQRLSLLLPPPPPTGPAPTAGTKDEPEASGQQRRKKVRGKKKKRQAARKEAENRALMTAGDEPTAGPSNVGPSAERISDVNDMPTWDECTLRYPRAGRGRGASA